MKKFTCTSIAVNSYRLMKKVICCIFQFILSIFPFAVKISQFISILLLKNNFLSGLFSGIVISSLLSFSLNINRIITFFIISFFAFSVILYDLKNHTR